MKTTLLTEKEDMIWLGETHLRHASPRPAAFDARDYAAAMIEGNEDCPQSISLWKKEPMWNTPATLVYKLQNDGSYKLSGGTGSFAKFHLSR